MISAEFDSRHGQTVQQMKQFVARLPQMTQAKQSLATRKNAPKFSSKSLI
jgi:hypothetical protein